MPSKFRLKKYTPNSIYHIYNRGIDGREVFGEEEDFIKFLDILTGYLVKPQEEKVTIYKGERPYIKRRKALMNLAEELEMLAMCLMNNHIHLLIWQANSDGVKKLMQRSMTHYSMYYNRKYHRTGPLFENVYKGVEVEEGEPAVLMTKYIHTNPVYKQVKRYGLVETSAGIAPEYYMYSSYGNYLGRDMSRVDRELIKPEKILEWYKSSQWGSRGMGYHEFVSEPVSNWRDILGDLIIEDYNPS